MKNRNETILEINHLTLFPPLTDLKMSSAPSTSFNPLKIALTATGVIAAATVGYAVYFDYRRRNDPVFRKKLREYFSHPLLPL